MIEQYNAFISYKHADLDIKTAEMIERGLEHFHIPRAIQKKTGIKRINHIFRDKDELPITSDLTEQLAYALDHSDFLIVICSPNTKTSAWVPREIEYFLRSHQRSNVLTVIADGEPYDVIPEILLSEDRMVTDENGNSIMVRVPLEPLSCDFRMSKRRAKREELPRLASALLSCSYSELIDRQRQYRFRRSLIWGGMIAAVACSFIAYVLYSRDSIKRAYMESLKNQSRYLANEAFTLLNNEDRITALQLALAALPQCENDDRPVTPEAVRALTNATLSYVSLSGNNISAAWNYTMSNIISGFLVSTDGSYLAANDITGALEVWDTTTHAATLKKNFNLYDKTDYRFISDTSLLVIMQSNAILFNAADGSVIWEHALADWEYFTYDPILSSTEDSISLLTNQNLIILDSSTGEEVKTYPVPKIDENYGSPSKGVISPDEKYFAFCEEKDVGVYNLYVWELATGKVLNWDEKTGYMRDIIWVDNEHLLVAVSEYDVYSGSMSLGNKTITSSDKSTICYIERKDKLQTIWKSEFMSDNVKINSGFLLLPAQKAVAYYSANVSTVYELETGEIMYRHNTNAPILDISDNDKNGYPLYITSEGAMANPYPAKGEGGLSMTYAFVDDLLGVVVRNGVYARQKNSQQIIYYATRQYDENWDQMGGPFDNSELLYDYFDKNVLAILTQAENEPEVRLTAFNLNNDGKRSVIPLQLSGEYTTERYAVLGSTENHLYLAKTLPTDTYALYDVDLTTETATQLFEYPCIGLDCATFSDGRLFTTSGTVSKYVLNVYDISDKSHKEYAIDTDSTLGQTAPAYFADDDCVFIFGNPFWIVNLKSGKTVPCNPPDDWIKAYNNTVVKSESGSFAVYDTKSIVIYAKDGKEQLSIGCVDKDVAAIGFYKDILLIATENGFLYRYDITNGSKLGTTQISNFTGTVNTAEFCFDEENRLLYLQNDTLTSVIETETWIELACVSNCYGYSSVTDRFYTTSYSDDTGFYVGSFPHYTTEELIKKAEDLLQGQKLTTEQKVKYGISDTDN